MSCLFDSLAISVNRNINQLRQDICRYLRTNPPLLDDMKASDVVILESGLDLPTSGTVGWSEEQTLRNYIRRMSRAEAWGGAIELKAFCDLFSVDIMVHVQYTNLEFEMKSSGNVRKRLHINYNGSHFTPLYTEFIA